MRIIELEGTPRRMGEAFGETCRAEIQAFYQRRLANAIKQAQDYGGRRVNESDVLSCSASCLAIAEGFDPDGYAELTGIARAADLLLEKVYAMNGLTDIRDVLAWGPTPDGEGCSSFIVHGDLTTDGRLLCGQTWDLSTDNMPFVLGVHRKPADAPATWCLTTVGCLSLIGMNEEGIAIGTTNLRTTDARPGVCYLSMIHKALGTRTQEDAIETIVHAPRAGAHYYFVCDGAGHAAGLECTATLFDRRDVTRGHHVQCNHVLVDAHSSLEGDGPKTSSMCRRKRLDSLIADAEQGSLDAAALRGFLSDHTDGPGAICRHDLDGISSNGAVIMSPQQPLLSMCHGHPCESEWIEEG